MHVVGGGGGGSNIHLYCVFVSRMVNGQASLPYSKKISGLRTSLDWVLNH